MNEKTTYELIIAERLEQLPIPDMADSIWSRIEAQLDLDMPENDGGNDPAPDLPKSGGRFLVSIGLFIFVASFITIFFTSKNNQTTQAPAPSESVPGSISPPKAPDNTEDKPIRPKEKVLEPVPPVDSPFATISTPVDSSTLLQTNDRPAVDSSQLNVIADPSPLQTDTLIKKKKPKGVPGISDSDYKISPAKKDSS